VWVNQALHVGCAIYHGDAVIALAMAVERAQFKPEPVELLGWV
jgi:hypothetical protein